MSCHLANAAGGALRSLSRSDHLTECMHDCHPTSDLSADNLIGLSVALENILGSPRVASKPQYKSPLQSMLDIRKSV